MTKNRSKGALKLTFLLPHNLVADCPISFRQVLKCQLPSHFKMLFFSKSPFLSKRRWIFKNYFEFVLVQKKLDVRQRRMLKYAIIQELGIFFFFLMSELHFNLFQLQNLSLLAYSTGRVLPLFYD